MTIDPTPTPDLAAYGRAMRMSTAELVAALAEQLGWLLVAYLGRVNDTRTARQWSEGTRQMVNTADVERLRLAFRVASLITYSESPAVAQAWFQGLNPDLDDVSPARMLREGQIEVVGTRVLAAARQFAGSG